VIEILAPGPLATVQDLGRAGWAALGVPRSGAFDRAAAALANRLVGNDPHAAVVEITLGGLALRALTPVTVAITGAVCPGADWGAAEDLAAGREVRLGVPRHGLRSYLAVRGGVDAPRMLGSASTDLLSGLGPPRLAAGDRLAVGPPPHRPPSGAVAPPLPGPAALQVLPGPRADWFAEDALERLCTTPWTVRDRSDRIGVRLDGPALPRVGRGELPSEPTLPGAVQVPADGRPIVFGPDGPVTGGYPVLAVLTDAALDAAGQLRPGDRVRFRPGSGAGSARPAPRPARHRES
jgi:biotin-dependent carboxylase-like uncharacterized protein